MHALTHVLLTQSPPGWAVCANQIQVFAKPEFLAVIPGRVRGYRLSRFFLPIIFFLIPDQIKLTTGCPEILRHLLADAVVEIPFAVMSELQEVEV
jgi:hypothetical protein